MAIDRSLRNSPRYLTLQHAYKVKQDDSGNVPDIPKDVTSRLKKLVKGQEMLYSYFGPGLSGGPHSVISTQTIAADDKYYKDPNTKKDPETQQEFHVKAPQYTLPNGAIHSVFPPSGSQTSSETLPHLLFNDPFMPWERQALGEGDDRGRMPWLALLVFSQKDLQLDDKLLNGDGSLFKRTSLADRPVQMSPEFALNLPIEDLTKIDRTLYPTPTPDDKAARSNAIIIDKRLFGLLTTEYDVYGNAKVDQTVTDISRYQYLAHVRHSMAEGLEATGEAESLFSVVFSHRLGPLSDDKPGRAITHLVSLEAWSQVDRRTLLTSTNIDYVVLSSLYSWSYTVLPTNAPSIHGSFQKLKDNLDVLRVPRTILKEARENNTNLGHRIKQRLQDGYTMAKYRTQTGEETGALVRGALSPVVPPDTLADHWTSISVSGGSLQIFDQETGLMDLTYSIAWSLGKSLALADQTFTTSLSRLRIVTEHYALNEAKKDTLTETSAWGSADDLIKSLPHSLDTLFKLAMGKFGARKTKSASALANESPVDLSRTNTTITTHFEDAVTRKIFHFAGSDDEKGKKLFNELNTPNSTDWMVVMSWVMDKMYLFGVPAQYLVIEPSFLPDESLRFFHIDPHWIDALIDGALSIANHISQEDDILRRVIKGAFNTYFKTIDPDLKYRPQIPTYGCFLRSHLVKDFPDLHITAPFPSDAAPQIDLDARRRAPILRQERLADDTLLCLFDRVPGKKDLHTLTFTQPAHQQNFVVGDEISSERLITAYERTYTIEPADKKYNYKRFESQTFSSKPEIPPANPTDARKRRIFIWGDANKARFLNMTGLAADVLAAVQADKVAFDDTLTTSSLIGYQLGSRIYQLTLISEYGQQQLSSLAVATEEPRQFKMLNRQQPLLQANTTSSIATLQSRGFLGQAEQLGNLAKTTSISPHLPKVRQGSEDKIPPELLIPPSTAGVMKQNANRDAGAPRFDWKVYPLGAYNAAIPSKCRHAQDLVFAITLASGGRYAFDIISIKVQVPMGKKDNVGSKTNLLETYKGSGPTMLSNLRFNVLIKRSKNYLDLTLLPRSTTGTVRIGRVRECSFLLPLVDVLDYDKDASPTIFHTVKYKNYREQIGTVEPVLKPVEFTAAVAT